MRSRLSNLSVSVILILLFALAGYLSLLSGSAKLTPSEVWDAILGVGDDAYIIIIQELRLPRLYLAFLVGAALGASGAALQGMLKNPLAEPGVVGISASAALGAVISLYFNVSLFGSLTVPIFAMVGALVATLILYFVAFRDVSVLTLILVGIAVNSLAGALTSLALNLSPNPFALNDILLWLLGSLSNRSMDDVLLLLPFVFLGIVVLLSTGRALSALTLGDDVAQSLGFDLRSVRGRIVLGTALAVGASVATVGSIGFVGLVIPHILRPFVGNDPKKLMVPSMFGGALLVLLSDLAVRFMPGGQELRLGVVTALIGAPFFLYLVISTRKAMR